MQTKGDVCFGYMHACSADLFFFLIHAKHGERPIRKLQNLFKSEDPVSVQSVFLSAAVAITDKVTL